MEKEFFKDLPDTSTPLNASRLNKLLNGKESMGDITVESIKSKNLLMLSNPLEVTLSKEIVGDFEAGTYTLSVSDIQSSGTSADYLFLFVGYSSEEYYVYLRQDRLSYTFDLPWNAEKLVIYSQHGYADSVDITTTFEDVMLEKGNEATSYSSFKDFVIEAGENENGTWEKWASGKMICRGLISRYVEGGHIEQVSGWYVSERIQVNFPKPFIEEPMVTGSGWRTAGDRNGIVVFIGSISADSFYAWSGTLQSTTSTGWRRTYEAVGKWK